MLLRDDLLVQIKRIEKQIDEQVEKHEQQTKVEKSYYDWHFTTSTIYGVKNKTMGTIWTVLRKDSVEVVRERNGEIAGFTQECFWLFNELVHLQYQSIEVTIAYMGPTMGQRRHETLMCQIE